MAKYVVTVFRSEAVVFEIEAEDADDAQKRYGMEAEEVGGETTHSEVTGVHLASEYYAATEITAPADSNEAQAGRRGPHMISPYRGRWAIP